MPDINNGILFSYIGEVQRGLRKFETAAQSISRMILEKKVEKKTCAGRTVYDFAFFRQGSYHIIGWYSEINEFVHFVKNALSTISALSTDSF